MPLIRRDAPPATPDRDAPVSGTVPSLAAVASEDRRAAARRLVVTAETRDATARVLFQENDESVLQALFTALVRSSNPTSVGIALELLRSDDARLRTGALDALKAMPAHVLPHMAQLLRDADTDVRILACDLARAQPPEAIVELLGPVLETDGDGNVCGAAIEVMADVATPEHVPLLLRCAERFPADPFLAFSARTAAQRIGARNGKP